MSGTSGTSANNPFATSTRNYHKKMAERLLPKEQYCPKCESRPNEIHRGPVFPEKYCSDCGTKLDTRIADVYVDLCYGQYEKWDTPKDVPDPYADDNMKPEPQPQNKFRLSLKALYYMMKTYEEELFVDNL